MSDSTHGPQNLRVQPVFHQPAHALLRPDRVVVCTEYFFLHWRPRLGPERAALVEALRYLAAQIDKRGPALQHIEITAGRLAEITGMTARQVLALLQSEPLPDEKPWRQLQSPEEKPGYKAYVADQVVALRHFIPRLRYASVHDPLTGKTLRTGYILEIALDDPLLPEDQALLEAPAPAPERKSVKPNIGFYGQSANSNICIYAPHCQERKCKNWVLRGVNPNICTGLSVNLPVTETDVSGSADSAALPTISQAPEAVARPRRSAPPNDAAQSLPNVSEIAAPPPSGFCESEGERTLQGNSLRSVDLDLPLPQLKQRALADLRRAKRAPTQITIVAQFIGRLLGLGCDDAGLPRRKPDKADHARVGELCKRFTAEAVLSTAFAVAGRLPDDLRDPLAYLQVSLENQRRDAQEHKPKPRSGRGERGCSVDLDQFTAEDYLNSYGGGAS
jgi:hypothetical protein